MFKFYCVQLKKIDFFNIHVKISDMQTTQDQHPNTVKITGLHLFSYIILLVYGTILTVIQAYGYFELSSNTQSTKIAKLMLGMTILNFIAFICQMPELMYKIKHYGEEVLENDQSMMRSMKLKLTTSLNGIGIFTSGGGSSPNI